VGVHGQISVSCFVSGTSSFTDNKMDPFEAASDAAPSVDAAFGSDPASEFLEREKEELADVLGQDDFVAVESAAEVEAVPEATPEAAAVPDVGLMASQMDQMRVSPQMSAPIRIEPETIRVWREENAKRLAEKDAKEEEMLDELREQAKKELTDWYKHYKEQVEKTKSFNRESEMEFVAEVNDIKPGTEWERVNKLVDFNSKHSKSTKDTTRMKSIMLQLKQNPPSKAAA